MAAASDSGQLVTRPMGVVFVALVTLPMWIGGVGLYQYLGIEVAIWIIYALGFNLLLGSAGLPSFGHGAFLGVGAYAFGLTQFHIVESLWVGLLAAILVGIIAGAVVGAFLAHRRGIYFALMTVAFGQVFWFVSLKWFSVTGGEDGLLGIPRPPVEFGFARIDISGSVEFYYFTLAILALVLVGMWRLVNSPYGKVIRAIKQNETRARFLGYNVRLFKWTVFVISAAVSALAGALFAMAQQSAFPDVMNLASSGTIVMMVLIGGGFVSFWGPVVGVVVFFVARDVLGAVTETWLLWFGLMFMVSVMFKPEGIAGMWQDLRRRKRGDASPTRRPALLRRWQR